MFQRLVVTKLVKILLPFAEPDISFLFPNNNLMRIYKEATYIKYKTLKFVSLLSPHLHLSLPCRPQIFCPRCINNELKRRFINQISRRHFLPEMFSSI
jgi:hypothetical protein